MKMAMKEGTTGNDEKSLKLRTLENKTCCAQYGMAYHNVETSYFIQLKMCYLMTYHGLTATRHIIGHLGDFPSRTLDWCKKTGTRKITITTTK